MFYEGIRSIDIVPYDFGWENCIDYITTLDWKKVWLT